jgi:hypothetical protein
MNHNKVPFKTEVLIFNKEVSSIFKGGCAVGTVDGNMVGVPTNDAVCSVGITFRTREQWNAFSSMAITSLLSQHAVFVKKVYVPQSNAYALIPNHAFNVIDVSNEVFSHRINQRTYSKCRINFIVKTSSEECVVPFYFRSIRDLDVFYLLIEDGLDESVGVECSYQCFDNHEWEPYIPKTFIERSYAKRLKNLSDVDLERLCNSIGEDGSISLEKLSSKAG